jgi:hypothetical protein
MADAPEGEPAKLHNEAVREAGHARTTIERFQSRRYRNIRVYRETQEISFGELLADIDAEAAKRRT